MAAAASADEAPQIAIPRDYNAAVDLIERNLKAGRGGKVAFRDDRGAYTYAELAERVDRAANALRALGFEPEQRLLLCLLDTIDFPTVFLGAIKAGIVPIAVNTLLTTADYDFMLRDSRARGLVVSDALYDRLAPILAKQPALKQVIVSGTQPIDGRRMLSDLMAAAAPRAKAAETSSDDACFWLYSSGSTGTPKGVVHLHSHLILTAELYAKPILGITEKDIVFSASKLFFAYGLGNSLTFPMSVGATAVLLAERATPAAVFRILKQHKPTIFCGVPTLYAAMLASPDLPPRGELALRVLQLRRRAAARQYRQPLHAAFRRRDPRRHRLDRDAAHLSVEPAGPGALRHDGTARPRLRAAPRRRRRQAGGAWRDRRAAGLRPDQRRLLLEQPRAQPPDLPRSMDAQRRQICRGQGRLFHLLRPHRRHDEGRAACMCRRPKSSPR